MNHAPVKYRLSFYKEKKQPTAKFDFMAYRDKLIHDNQIDQLISICLSKKPEISQAITTGSITYLVIKRFKTNFYEQKINTHIYRIDMERLTQVNTIAITHADELNAKGLVNQLQTFKLSE